MMLVFVILELTALASTAASTNDAVALATECARAIVAPKSKECVESSRSLVAIVECFEKPTRDDCSREIATLAVILMTGTTSRDAGCRETIVNVAKSCLERDDAHSFYNQLVQHPGSRVRRAPAPIGLADIFNTANLTCADTLIEYGFICQGILNDVLADAAILASLNASLVPKCSKDWRTCLSNVQSTQGSLDHFFEFAIKHYGDLCGNDCWKKSFGLVENCLSENNPIKKSYIQQKSFIMDYLEVMCINDEADVSCGRLELEFYFMRQGIELNNPSTAICNVADLKAGQCPSSCKNELNASTSFLGCCLGSQLKVPDPNDVIGYEAYFRQCHLAPPLACNKAHFDVRQRSKACHAQLTKLTDQNYASLDCALNFDAFIDIIAMSEDAAKQVICVDGLNFGYCRSILNERLRDLASSARVLCQPHCFRHVEQTLEICAADLNLTATARLPLTLMCYETSQTETENSNCAVKYQEYIEKLKSMQTRCSTVLPVNGKCPFECLVDLNSMISSNGLGCCLASQFYGNFSVLDRIYFNNLKLCLPQVTGGIPAKCSHIPLPTPSPSPGNSVGAIVGGTIGGILALIVIGLMIYCFCFNEKKPSGEKERVETDYAELINE